MQAPTPETCHWLQFNAPPVGLHPAAQVRNVHSVKKRRPPQQQQLVPPATRRDTTGGACPLSYIRVCGYILTLPPACEQWGCPAVVCVWVMAGNHCPSINTNTVQIPCLLYADDIVILSQTKTGLQNKSDRLHDYCSACGLHINRDKTKVIIFTRTDPQT